MFATLSALPALFNQHPLPYLQRLYLLHAYAPPANLIRVICVIRLIHDPDTYLHPLPHLRSPTYALCTTCGGCVCYGLLPHLHSPNLRPLHYLRRLCLRRSPPLYLLPLHYLRRLCHLYASPHLPT